MITEARTGELLREHLSGKRGAHRIRAADRPRRTPPQLLQLLARGQSAHQANCRGPRLPIPSEPTPCHRPWITPQGATPAGRNHNSKHRLEGSILNLANARGSKVQQSRLTPIPLAGFELITYGRF
jgi:hypothetical protein